MNNSIASNYSKIHITVGATPFTQDKKTSLINEIRLLKVALLYGDKVKFCGLGASVIVHLFKNIDVLSPFDLLIQLEPFIKSTELVNQEASSEIISAFSLYRSLKAKPIKSTEERKIIEAVEQSIHHNRDAIKEDLLKAYPSDQISQLIAAEKSNLVEYSVYDVGSENISLDYIQEIYKSVANFSTYPLFDDFSGNLINSYMHMMELVSKNLQFSKIMPPISKSLLERDETKQTSLCSGLFERLPSFENCSVDEILDIRKELNQPLIRFRGAVSSLSKKLESIPYTEEFKNEVEKLLISEVAPSIMEIENNVKAIKPIFKIAEKIAVNGSVGGGISLMLSSIDNLERLTFLPILASLATSTYLGLKEARLEKEKVQQNQLYFLYSLAKKY